MSQARASVPFGRHRRPSFVPTWWQTASTVLAVVLLLALPWHAAVTQASGTANSNEVQRWSAIQQNFGNFSRIERVCGPTQADISGSCGVTGLTVHAHSDGAGNTLHASASTQASTAPYQLNLQPAPGDEIWGVSTFGSATLWDRITLGGVTPATLRFTYAITGLAQDLSVNGQTDLNAGAFLLFGASQTVDPATLLQGVYSSFLEQPGTGTRSVADQGFVDYQVTGTAPVAFQLQLGSAASLSAALGQPLNGTAMADFATAVRIQALDASGRDITRAANMVFASGAAYSQLATVPEPRSVLLVATGFGGLYAGARRRARRITTH